MRSSVREFVASEAMAALGLPTTRALSLVATGDKVLRDMFYKYACGLHGYVLCVRVCPFVSECMCVSLSLSLCVCVFLGEGGDAVPVLGMSC